MRHEFAETADDILWRRTKLGLRMSAEDKAALTHFVQRNAEQPLAAE